MISEFGSPEEVVIRVTGTSSDLTNDIADKMHKILAPSGKIKTRRVDMVGAKVGGKLSKKRLISVGLFLLVMLIYVSFRFEWRCALFSILALVHDSIIALVVISLFRC
mgnify:FL=1